VAEPTFAVPMLPPSIARRRAGSGVTYAVVALLDGPARTALYRHVLADLLGGVRAFTIDLAAAGPLDDRFGQTIADVFARIHEVRTPGPRAALALVGVSAEQRAQLERWRITHVVPVELRDGSIEPLTLTEEIPL